MKKYAHSLHPLGKDIMPILVSAPLRLSCPFRPRRR